MQACSLGVGLDDEQQVVVRVWVQAEGALAQGWGWVWRLEAELWRQVLLLRLLEVLWLLSQCQLRSEVPMGCLVGTMH